MVWNYAFSYNLRQFNKYLWTVKLNAVYLNLETMNPI